MSSVFVFLILTKPLNFRFSSSLNCVWIKLEIVKQQEFENLKINRGIKLKLFWDLLEQSRFLKDFVTIKTACE